MLTLTLVLLIVFFPLFFIPHLLSTCIHSPIISSENYQTLSLCLFTSLFLRRFLQTAFCNLPDIHTPYIHNPFLFVCTILYIRSCSLSYNLCTISFLHNSYSPSHICSLPYINSKLHIQIPPYTSLSYTHRMVSLRTLRLKTQPFPRLAKS